MERDNIIVTKLAAIWRDTHRDYRGIQNGEKSILMLRKGGTTIVPLSALTDEEIEAKRYIWGKMDGQAR